MPFAPVESCFRPPDSSAGGCLGGARRSTARAEVRAVDPAVLSALDLELAAVWTGDEWAHWKDVRAEERTQLDAAR